MEFLKLDLNFFTFFIELVVASSVPSALKVKHEKDFLIRILFQAQFSKLLSNNY